MPRSTQLSGASGWIEGDLNGGGTVFSGNAGGYSVFNASVDAHREGGFVGIGVAIDHQRKIEFIKPLALHRQTNQSTRLGGHEVDGFRRSELGSADQISFIFPLLVIHHNDAGTIANVRQSISDGIEADRLFRSGRSDGVQSPDS